MMCMTAAEMLFVSRSLPTPAATFWTTIEFRALFCRFEYFEY